MANEQEDNIIRGRFGDRQDVPASRITSPGLTAEREHLNAEFASLRGQIIPGAAEALNLRDLKRLQVETGEVTSLLKLKDTFSLSIEDPATEGHNKLALSLLNLGTDVVISKKLKRIKEFLKKGTIPQLRGQLDRYGGVMDVLFHPEYIVKVNGLSFEDIAPGKKIDNTRLFFHVLKGALASANSTESELIDSDQPDSLKEYPETVSGFTEIAAQHLAYLGFMSGTLMHAGTDGERDLGLKEIQDNMASMAKRVNLASKDVFRTLQKPGNPGMLEVAIGLSDLIEANPEKTIFIFQFLKWDSDRDLSGLYRFFKDNAENPEYGWFYSMMAEKLGNDIDEVASEVIPTIEDQETFLAVDPTPMEFYNPDFLQQTKKLGINQRLLLEQYVFDPADLDLDHLVSPKLVSIDFKKGKPGEFTVHFDYENPEGEATTIDFFADVNAKKYDWNFKEKPEEAPFLWNTISRGVGSILNSVSAEIDRVAQERKVVVMPSSTSTTKREYPGRDEVYSLRREARKAAAESFHEVAGEVIYSSEKAVKNTILIPDNLGELDKVLKLSQEDKERVLEEIRRGNEEGAIVLHKLHALGDDGEPRFSYKTKKSRGIRILVKLSDNQEEGSKSFDIVGGKYRQNAYRNI